MGETSREDGREDETLPRGTIVDGLSGSIDVRGDTEIPRDEGREDTDEGRDTDPWFLTADACVRKGLTFFGILPARGGVCGIELFTGV